MEYLSQECYDRLTQELNELVSVELPKARNELEEARAKGDLSENFEYHVNPAKRNVLDLKNETCKNREKRNVLKISHTRHFKTTKSSPKRAAFIVLNGKQTAFK